VEAKSAQVSPRPRPSRRSYPASAPRGAGSHAVIARHAGTRNAHPNHSHKHAAGTHSVGSERSVLQCRAKVGVAGKKRQHGGAVWVVGEPSAGVMRGRLLLRRIPGAAGVSAKQPTGMNRCKEVE